MKQRSALVMTPANTENRPSAADLRLLAAIVADSNDAVTVQDLEGRILVWNPAAERTYGYSRGEALQMNAAVLVPSGERARARGLLQAVARGEKVTSVEVRRLTKDGRTLDVSLTMTALVDDQGHTVGVATTERDVTERAVDALRESAEAARRSSGLLRMLADSIPDPVFVKDEQSRMLFANPATLEAIGKPAQEVLGRSDREFFDDEETGATIVENDRKVMAVGEAMTIEERVETASGTRWFLTTKSPVRDASGKVTGLIGVTRDITFRKRAEEALRESEERFRAFVTASSDVVYRMSPDWREMRELRGREFIADTDAPSRGWLEKYIHPDDQPHVLAVIDEAIRTKGVFQLQHRVLRLDGTLGWTFSRAIPLLDANGAIVEWIGAATDVTARKRAEDALRESEERFRLLVHGVKDCAIYMLAPDGTVSSWSVAAEQMLGYREEEIVGKHRRVFFTDGQRTAGRPEQELAKALALGRSEEEAWRVTKDGARFWANVLITPVYDDGGSLRGFASVTRDFTDRKRAENALRESEERLRASEAALREADRRRTEFLAVLSHELRNPLAPIRNSLYILEHAAPGGEQAKRAQAIDRPPGRPHDPAGRRPARRHAHHARQDPAPARAARSERAGAAHGRGPPDRSSSKSDIRLEVLPAPSEALGRRRPSAPRPGHRQPAPERGQVHAARREDDRLVRSDVATGRAHPHAFATRGAGSRPGCCRGSSSPSRRPTPPSTAARAASASGSRSSRGSSSCTAAR